jgi:hypothetical protein
MVSDLVSLEYPCEGVPSRGCRLGDHRLRSHRVPAPLATHRFDGELRNGYGRRVAAVPKGGLAIIFNGVAWASIRRARERLVERSDDHTVRAIEYSVAEGGEGSAVSGLSRLTTIDHPRSFRVRARRGLQRALGDRNVLRRAEDPPALAPEPAAHETVRARPKAPCRKDDPASSSARTRWHLRRHANATGPARPSAHVSAHIHD